MAKVCCAGTSSITSRLKLVAFKLKAPKAKSVHLAGSFNNWDTRSNPAVKDFRGTWQAKVSLKPGKYEYKFFVDGNWVDDPECSNCVTNNFGTKNCIIEVR